MENISAARDAGNFRKRLPLKVTYGMIPTLLGWVGVVEHSRGVLALLWGGKSTLRLREKIQKQFPLAFEKEGVFFRKTRFFLNHFFTGKLISPPSVDLSFQTPFQKRVLRKVCRIPRGEVRSYAWLAREIGSPGSARACGQALHKNPFPLLIPCHRVVPSSGKKGGFVWGVRMKERLLQREAAEPQDPKK